MYEQFRNQFTVALAGHFSDDVIDIILSELDKTAYDYEISKKSTEIVVYNDELPEIVKTYLVCKRMEGLSDGTLYNYGHYLQMFFRNLQKSPDQVTANDIRVYLYRYQEERKVTNRTLDKYREYIARFYQWAFDEGYIGHNPSRGIKKIKYEVKPRLSLNQMELEYVRMACKTVKEKAIVEFLYSTGCRVSELAGIKKSDVDYHTKSVHLFGKGNKHRISFLNAKAEVALKEYLLSRDDNNPYLFVSDRNPHNQMHKSGVEKIVREISKRASCNVNKHITPHVFRHTTATTAIRNGMEVEDISKLLGHESINTTMIYAKTSLENVKASHKKYII